MLHLRGTMLPIPANPLDILNAEMARIRNQGIRLVVRSRTKVDIGSMRDAISSLTEALPALRSRYDDVGRCFVPCGDVPSVSRVSDTAPERLARAGNGSMDIRLMDRGKGDAIVIDVDHTLTDGRGLVRIARSLLDVYDGGEPSSETDRSIDRLWDVCGTEGISESDPVHYPVPMIDVRGGTVDSVLELDRTTTSDVIDVAHDIGVTVNDLLTASMMLTVRGRVGDVPRQGVIVPVDMRRHMGDEWRDRTCNLSSSVDVAIDGGILDLEDMAHAVSDRMTEMREGTLGMGVLLSSDDPATIVDSILSSRDGHASSLLLTNLGTIAPMFLDGEEVDDVRFLASPNWPPTLTCVASTYGGRMTLSTPYCEGSMTATEASSWTASMIDMIVDHG